MELFILLFLLTLFIALFRVFGREGDRYGYYNQPRGWKNGTKKQQQVKRSKS